jgi:hypothetical protein
MSWFIRYANENEDFNELIKSTVQKEAEEKMQNHEDQRLKHEYILNDLDDTDKNSLLYHLHVLAHNAHNAAHAAWNFVWNQAETPHDIKEYDDSMSYNLRINARNLTSHANHATELIDSLEED